MSYNPYYLPLRDIPNFSAAFGKSPRSTVLNVKFLLEYLSIGKHKYDENIQFLKGNMRMTNMKIK